MGCSICLISNNEIFKSISDENGVSLKYAPTEQESELLLRSKYYLTYSSIEVLE